VPRCLWDRKTKCRHPYVAPRVVSISFRIGGTQNQAANPSFRVPSYLHRKAHEYGKTTHAFHRALGQNQYSDAGLRQSRRRHSSTRDLRNSWPDKKNFLAMPIHSDMKAGGLSRGTISRGYEAVGKNPSVYLYFERRLRLARLGYGLSFRRDSGECSVYSR